MFYVAPKLYCTGKRTKLIFCKNNFPKSLLNIIKIRVK